MAGLRYRIERSRVFAVYPQFLGPIKNDIKLNQGRKLLQLVVFSAFQNTTGCDIPQVSVFDAVSSNIHYPSVFQK